MDGKTIQLISGIVQDRLAICISIPNQTSGQFLASPELACGTGKNMAHALHDCLAENEMVDKAEAVVFGTTSGKWREVEWSGGEVLFFLMNYYNGCG